VTRSPEDTESPRSRWAIILVRLPQDHAALNAVLPRSRPVQESDLPLVTRITHDLSTAHETAQRLRQTGAQVVIVEEPVEPGMSAFCTDHPAQLAARSCQDCSAAICPGCMVDAGGSAICRACHLKEDSKNHSTRRRQLLFLLVFVAFLYKVWGHLKKDIEQVSGSTPITIGIVQFTPTADMGANIIRELNQGPIDVQNGTTLRALAPWLNAEHTRYTGNRDRRFRVETRGPFAVNLQPPLLYKEGDSWLAGMFRAWRYPQYFHNLASDNGVPIDTYTVKVYVMYGGTELDMASHSRGSRKGRVAMVFVSIDETNPAYALTTMTHEIGHALGAADSYDPVSSRSIHPQGFVEPFSNPLYPQRFAELMSVDIPLSPSLEKEVATLSTVRVGHQTAADLGWIDQEQADLFYAPTEITPEEKLSPELNLPPKDTRAPTLQDDSG
jgi:hypothetical protein